MKCVKTIRKPDGYYFNHGAWVVGDILRADDELAAVMVLEGLGTYCPKHEWKAQVRTGM